MKEIVNYLIIDCKNRALSQDPIMVKRWRVMMEAEKIILEGMFIMQIHLLMIVQVMDIIGNRKDSLLYLIHLTPNCRRYQSPSPVPAHFRGHRLDRHIN